MTYAEMEGFLDAAAERADAPRSAAAPPRRGASSERTIERWLAWVVVAVAVIAACAMAVARSAR